jgi:diguanylate cyclase (GGDEF)-like protein
VDIALTSTRRASPRALIALAIAVLALVVLVAFPIDSSVSLWTQLVVEAACVAVVAVSAARMSGAASLVWWCLGGYLLLTLAGDVVYDVQQHLLDQEPFPGPSDVLYLAAYVAEVVALLAIVRRRHLVLDRAAWIDWAIITGAALAVLGSLVLIPMLADPGQAGPVAAMVAVAYPVLDLLILAILVRLLLGGGNSNVALVLLTVSVLVTLSADLIYNGLAVMATTDAESGPLTALFTAGFLLMAAASVAPGARTVTESEPAATQPMTRFHGLALALGTLTAPVLLLVVSRDAGSKAVGFLAAMSILVNLLVVWRTWMLLQVVREQADDLALMARTDTVTGLPNRRSWDFELDRALAAVTDDRGSLVVAMLDLDDFKRVNDERGHQAGDAVLASCAAAWRAAVDARCYLARYGGEEFAALLPGVTGTEAEEVLDRVRRATPRPQTVSIGYAVLTEGESSSALLRRADQALYLAKSRGKDRVVAGASAYRRKERPATTGDG